MSLMLPATPAHARSLTGVAGDLLAALDGAGTLAPARSVVLLVVDGLGAMQLREYAGHARHLAALLTRKSVARTVFPSTTAAALTSILTGTHPGEHGLVGYSLLDPAQGKIVNQLTGWETDGIDPATWQRAATIFEQASAAGRPAYAVGPGEFVGSGFTRAVLRGATYVPTGPVRDRLMRALALADAEDGAVVYCYVPELDKAGHKHGVGSVQWLSALEELDSALSARIPQGVGLVITADHGMVNVPPHRHVLLDSDDDRWDGVALIGGEPRMLHVYTEPGVATAEVAERWRAAAGVTADVVTRDEMIELGLYGDVAPDVAARIGDVLVVTRSNWAYYDHRDGDTRAQGMIGQHGSITPEETIVPFLRAGAFAV